MDPLSHSKKRQLAKQGYHLVGQGAVKPCLWLNRSLRGGDQCYKHYFYGISSHRCVQMTPTIQCNQKCLHCWRPIDDPIIIETPMEPQQLLDAILIEHQRILSGYGGSEKIDRTRLKEAHKPSHVAISLMGEPTFYPHIKELIEEIKSRKMTSFLVTNGTNPHVLNNLNPTQLYLSLNAPSEDVYMRMSNPQENLWSKILDSLNAIKDHKSRTVIRMTLVRNLNMSDPIKFASLLKMAEPDFVEVKAYMHLGKSRERLARENMPSHKEVLIFALELGRAIGYELASQVPLSRVALLAKVEPNRYFIRS